jgi:hypothetical protein
MLFWGLVSSWAEVSSVVGAASLDLAGAFKSRSSDAALADFAGWSETLTPMVNAITKAKLRTKAPPLQWRLMAKKRDGHPGPGSPKADVGRHSH